MGQFCHPHVYDVLLLEVDLGRAPRSLQHQDVVFRCEGVIRLHDWLDQLPFILIIHRRIHVSDGHAIDDHLGTRIVGRLQQDGVHPHAGLHAGGLGLHNLRPAHFQPFRCDKRVERHVLRFERRHPVAILPEDPAKPRHQEALSRIGHCALHHNCLRHIYSSKAHFSAAIKRSFSSCPRTAMR